MLKLEPVIYKVTTLNKLSESRKTGLEHLTLPHGLMKNWLWEDDMSHPVAIAYLNKQPIGWAIVNIKCGTWDGSRIRNFIGCFVDEPYRSHGIGRKLSSLVIEKIDNNHELMYAWRAERFYRPVLDKYSNKIVSSIGC